MTAIFGERGIGKTFILAQECYRRYRKGFLIITNFDFVYSHINYSHRSPEDFYALLREILLFKERGLEAWNIYGGFHHTGIFIAIDEGHLFFSADLWKRYQDEPLFQDVIRVLAQARKMDIEIWYTCQDPAKIDINWRRYTEEWIKFRPVIPLRRKILIQHEKYPIYRRELRHIIPLMWMEYHALTTQNPTPNYSIAKDENGVMHWSPQSTMIRRHFRRSGWLDPFPYKLYDSNEILSVNLNRQELLDFSNLEKLNIIQHTYRHERFPTIKGFFRWLREKPFFGWLKIVSRWIRSWEESYPIRYFLEKVNLGEIPKGTTKKIAKNQEIKILPEKIAAQQRAKWYKQTGHTPAATQESPIR